MNKFGSAQSSITTQWLWLVFWLILFIVFAVMMPGYSESDASKYFSIAQHMVTTHHYWVPFWHGHEYSDKPPLLFWLFVLGWKVWGINHWWPQFLTLLFATGSLFLTKNLAKQFWPEKPHISVLLPYVLIGIFYWAWLAKQIRVDAMLTFFSVLGWLALVRVTKARQYGWFLYALSVGFGMLSKGPVILVFFIPALFIPFYLKLENFSLKRWYLSLLLASLFGIAIPLLWAIPAAIKGGPHFASAIFYGQISKRSHYHDQFIFYLVRLPFWLLPWTLYLPFWRGLFRCRFSKADFGITFCISIILVALLVFSSFGQKLPHYLYPLFPLFGLMITAVIVNYIDRGGRYALAYQWPIAFILLILGMALLIFPSITHLLSVKSQIRTLFIDEISLFWPRLFIAVSGMLLFFNTKSFFYQIVLMMLATLLINVFANCVFLNAYEKHMTSSVMIKEINVIQKEGEMLAYSGRLTDKSLRRYLQSGSAVQLKKGSIREWVLSHPRGWVITPSPCFLIRQKQKPAQWYYQSRFSAVSLWKAKQLRRNSC